jgi:predicted dehydrogenase
MKNKDRPKVAVVGCGAIAHEHLRFLNAFDAVDLVAVCDRSKATADFAKELFNARRSFTDHLDAFSETNPDVVHVCTPPETHGRIVIEALNAGAHVICEKPMTGTAAETTALLNEADRCGKLLVESRNMLFNDVVVELDHLIKQGRIGSIRDIDVAMSLNFLDGPFGDSNLSGPGVNAPAGVVHDFLPHLAYLFLHFAGDNQPVEQVAGFLENRSENPRVGFDHLDALIRTKSCRGRLRILSDVKPDMFRLALHGTEAAVETDFYNPYLRVQRGDVSGVRAPFAQIRSGIGTAVWGARNFRDKVLRHGPYHGLSRMLEAVYRSLMDGTAPPIRSTDIRATALLVDRIVDLGKVT